MKIDESKPVPYEPPPDPIDQLISERGYYWCQDSRKYAIKNSTDNGEWHVSDEVNMLREIAKRGYSRKAGKDASRSPAEIVLDRIRNTRQVDYIGAVCGRQAGYHESNGVKILCPSGFSMIEGREGDCLDMMYLWESLFGAGGENPHYQEQSDFMCGWLKAARACHAEL